MMRPNIGVELARMRVEELLWRSGRSSAGRGSTRRPLPRRAR
jgi:hypothetical protein